MIRETQRWLGLLPGVLVTNLGIARASKLAGLGALLLLLLMTASPAWGSSARTRASKGLEPASHRVLAADQLHQAVAREQAALDELRTPDDVEPQVTT